MSTALLLLVTAAEVAAVAGWLAADATRGTARVSVALYGIAVAQLLLRRPYRLAWTLGIVTFLIHLAVAFGEYHGWSHTHAFEHVRSVAGVGEGIFVSYLFTLLWVADVAWAWLSPSAHAGRPAWVTGVLHGFMAFIMFNGTVVYETGFIRWAGVVLFVVLGALLARRLAKL